MPDILAAVHRDLNARDGADLAAWMAARRDWPGTGGMSSTGSDGPSTIPVYRRIGVVRDSSEARAIEVSASH